MQNTKRYLEKIKKTAVVYCRTYSRERKTYNLVEQEKLVTDFASQNGYNILKIFLETDHSGKNFERPQLRAMLKYLDEHPWKIKFLLLSDMDRLCCNPFGLKRIRRFLRLSGVKVVSVLRSMLK